MAPEPKPAMTVEKILIPKRETTARLTIDENSAAQYLVSRKVLDAMHFALVTMVERGMFRDLEADDKEKDHFEFAASAIETFARTHSRKETLASPSKLRKVWPGVKRGGLTMRPSTGPEVKRFDQLEADIRVLTTDDEAWTNAWSTLAAKGEQRVAWEAFAAWAGGKYALLNDAGALREGFDRVAGDNGLARPNFPECLETCFYLTRARKAFPGMGSAESIGEVNLEEFRGGLKVLGIK